MVLLVSPSGIQYGTEYLGIGSTVLNNTDLDFLMKESREVYLLTMNIKKYVDDAMAQVTLAASRVGSVSVTLTQFVTPVSDGRLYAMHHPMNLGDQNIGVLQQTLTGL